MITKQIIKISNKKFLIKFKLYFKYSLIFSNIKTRYCNDIKQHGSNRNFITLIVNELQNQIKILVKRIIFKEHIILTGKPYIEKYIFDSKALLFYLTMKYMNDFTYTKICKIVSCISLTVKKEHKNALYRNTIIREGDIILLSCKITNINKKKYNYKYNIKILMCSGNFCLKIEKLILDLQNSKNKIMKIHFAKGYTTGNLAKKNIIIETSIMGIYTENIKKYYSITRNILEKYIFNFVAFLDTNKITALLNRTYILSNIEIYDTKKLNILYTQNIYLYSRFTNFIKLKFFVLREKIVDLILLCFKILRVILTCQELKNYIKNR